MKIKILRVVLCIVLAVSCFMLQSNFTRIIPILTAAPNLLLIVTFSVGFLKGRMWGMLTGLGCGLLLDSFSGGVLGYYTLIFIYIGYFNGIFTRVLAHDMVVMPVLLCSANELIYSVYIYVFSFLLFGRVNIADYINNISEELIDFNLLASSISGRILNEKTLNKKNKELINSLAFVYNLDTLKMSELLRLCLDESGSIDRELLKKEVRRYYEYNNGGKLPTLIYRTQPDYLKAPEGDLSNRGKMVYIFENTTPYDFIRSKYKIGTPTSSDLKILEYLAVDLNMTPAVINVLVDYVLRINNNKLTKAFVETIAGQWARLGIKTARDAMKEAEKEYKKKPKKETKTISSLPVWFNEETQKKELSEEEQKEMEALLKEFR